MFGWLRDLLSSAETRQRHGGGSRWRRGRVRRPDLLKYKEYEFQGITWVHRPITTEQWSILQQIIFELDQKDEIKTEADLQGKLLHKETIGKVLAALLVPSPREFDERLMKSYIPILTRFPAEWTGEVLRDFFMWNPSSGISLVVISTRSLAVKGISSRLTGLIRMPVSAN